jgi:hypothetical protein
LTASCLVAVAYDLVDSKLSCCRRDRKAGLLKIGYTTANAQTRIARQYPTKRPRKPPCRIVLDESAMRNDG